MNQTDEVLQKLDTLIRLVAIGICQDKGQKEKIAFLASAGITTKGIAQILGTTSNTVSVTLSGLKKKKKSTVKTKKTGNDDG